jgi:hypothetical protein
MAMMKANGLASLMGQGLRQERETHGDQPIGAILARAGPRTLAEALQASLPKSLQDALAEGLGVEMTYREPDDRVDDIEAHAESQATTRSRSRQLSRPIRDGADWIRRIEDKNDPDRALILAPDGVKFAPAFLN